MPRVATPSTTPNRLRSLDAFRGLAIAGMILVNNPGSWRHSYAPLQHADWHGWTPTDLVFPFFLFIAGAAIPLAFANQRDRGATTSALAFKALRRAVTLFALGLVLASATAKGWGPLATALGSVLLLSWGAARIPHRAASETALLVVWSALAYWLTAVGPPIRIPGVLQRIAVCYLLISWSYLFAPHRLLPWLAALLLFGYWALLTLVPVPGHGPGLLDSKAANLASYLDRVLLKGHIWIAHERDPEGPLSTLGALATTLFGLFAGQVLQSERTPVSRTITLFERGSALVVAGYAWGWMLPVNKPLWTSSYAVFTAGLATCALALLYWWIDVRGRHRAAAPMETYGTNAITVFVGSGLLARALGSIVLEDEPRRTALGWAYREFVAGGLAPINASLAHALLWVAAWYAVLRALKWRRIVIRV